MIVWILSLQILFWDVMPTQWACGEIRTESSVVDEPSRGSL